MFKKNRVTVAIAGMIMQLSIGAIYAYSVWIQPLGLSNRWDAHQLKFAFSLAICFLGLTAAFMSKFVQKAGPRKSGLIGAFFWGLGLVGAGFAVEHNSLSMFYLFYGVISGIGLGFGYITPVGVVVKWFKERPGFASGLVIMSFAAGSTIASKIIPWLASGMGVSNTLYLLGAVYFVLMALASFNLAPPDADSTVAKSEAPKAAVLPFKALITDVRFYCLWMMLFFNTVCGIALIALAAPLAKEIIHITQEQAITFVAIIGLFNGLGRLFWSSISDKIGRWNTFIMFFIIGAVCFFIISGTQTPWIFETAVFIVISCYGGAFATLPSYVKDIYGVDKVGSVFGYLLTAWSAAAFVGPWLITLNVSYQIIFYIFVGLLLFIATISILLKKKLQPGADVVNDSKAQLAH